MKYDPNAQEERSFEVLPAGEYVCDLVEFERKYTQKGDAYLKCKYRILQGKKAKWFITDGLFLTEKAAWRINAVCRAMRITEAFDLDDDNDVQSNMVGKLLKIKTVVSIEANKDGERREYAKADKFYALDKLELEEAQIAQEKLGLPDEDMRQAKTENTEETAVVADDDIPF
mgnify:CR=1 FL=1